MATYSKSKNTKPTPTPETTSKPVNKKELIKSIKELALEINATDEEAVEQRIRIETTIINCLEDVGGWENIKEANKSKKRLADLEELLSV